MMMKSTKYDFLIQQNKNNIYGYALYMLKNHMDADDVTQEVMIRIWNNINNFNILSAKSWIMRTTHNLCIDYLRKRKVVVQREFEINEELTESYLDDRTENDPYLTTHFEMMNDKVKIAISRLPETLKSVFVLYEIQGMKYKEISKSLEIPLNSVKVYLLRARKKLQEELKNYETHEVL